MFDQDEDSVLLFQGTHTQKKGLEIKGICIVLVSLSVLFFFKNHNNLF